MLKMEELYRKQEDFLENVVKAFTNYKKSPKIRITGAYIEARMESLESLWKGFNTIHSNIVAKIAKESKPTIEYFKDDVYNQFEDAYTEYKARLKEDMPRTTTTSVNSNTTAGCKVKLPQIQLPTFKGSYEEWQTFHDMFVSLIHSNTSLNPVQKLHYLKSCLSGDPERLLMNLATTESNYEEAWNQLTKRYNNKRYNVNEVMKRLFAQKSLTGESSTQIKHLLDNTAACLKALNNLGTETKSWDTIINYLVVSKLDSETRKAWELDTNKNESDSLPTWNDLVSFLETRFRTLEMLEENKPTTSKQISKKNTFHCKVEEEEEEKEVEKKDNTNNNKVTCVMCTNEHLLFQCEQFQKQSIDKRVEFVQSNRLCFNCFATNHNVKSCYRATCCRKCGRRHHTLLHFERTIQGPSPIENAKSDNPVAETSTKPESERKIVTHFIKENQNEVLLATALINVKSTNGYARVVRALIDQGSEASFVTEDTVQSLGLKRIPVSGLVSGVGDGEMKIKHMVLFNLESIQNPKFSVQVQAYVLHTLTSFLPTSKIFIKDWSEIEEKPLADPKYGAPGRIDVILGVEIYSEIILEGLLKHPENTGPIAQNTQLGWVLSGPVDKQSSSSRQKIVNLHIRVKEDELLQQFWEIEREPDAIKKKMTREEIKCEEIYEKTTVREENGRYKVRLPFKEFDTLPCLNNQSERIALHRFNLLEKKLQKNDTLKEEYKKVIDDYIDQTHMEQIKQREDINKNNTVYLPHHAVVKQDRETTKVRIVYDASCKGVNNISLNDTLLVGPKLQDDLRHILMRWRCHPYCIVADLAQMYRQILVHEDDTDFQRILWRADMNQPIQHFRLLRLTFGTACAPYLAVKSLQQVAKDERSNYPMASEITLRDYYMDDLLTGCETEAEAIQIFDQMNGLMNSGGFSLQKWCTNSEALIKYIKEENQKGDQKLVFKSDDVMKVLGICWNKNTDNFEYNYKITETNEPITKRRVLSDIARLYDPMGWIAPVIIVAKIFMQKLWKSNLSWDETLTEDLLKEWLNFRDSLSQVQNILLPRWLNTKKGNLCELHAFADASNVAYAATVYLKVQDEDKNVHVHLISSKTKVAPIDKSVSVPRLELCAALLTTKLLYEISQVMDVPKVKQFAWSDSTVVLAWLRGEPSRWTTFVSNRVSEILTMLDSTQWNHVSTHLNPADCASRGLSISDLMQHELWWYGPKFLLEDKDYTTNQSFTTTEEEKPIKVLATVMKPKEEFIWTAFSKLQKMLRVMAYCRRFLKLKLPKEQREPNTKIVTTTEIEEVTEICIRETQRLYFEEEIKALKTKNIIPKRSLIQVLNPYLDKNYILRVGGRIDKSEEELDRRHPVILPNESQFTKMIVLDAHHKTLHGGPQLMLNLLRSKYWIIRGRELTKKCYRQCIKCVRYARQNNNQLMGELPKARITPTRPFKSSGVDFTGHINIRFSPGRGSKSYKGYVCLFICMVTRAIHLEAVSDLTAKGFIAAFRRFVSRRGHCQDLYSDNGTNFVGADKELRQMFNRAVSELPTDINQLLTNEGTTWHFIPPHAPNFGGLWEAGVRSTKGHLKTVIGDTTLTFEELTTVLTQIEACLNSRPISYLSDNPNDPLPLTPGHFLVGEPLIVIPDKDYSLDQGFGVTRWRLCQKMLDSFWKKWSREYLVTLNNRYKWSTKRDEPEIDDVVIIKEDNLPPAKWLLGKIVKLHPGNDNITRVVTLKTKSGLCKRSCNKLCFIPKNCET